MPNVETTNTSPRASATTENIMITTPVRIRPIRVRSFTYALTQPHGDHRYQAGQDRPAGRASSIFSPTGAAATRRRRGCRETRVTRVLSVVVTSVLRSPTPTGAAALPIARLPGYPRRRP